MKKNILKKNSWLLVVLGFVLMLIIIIIAICVISTPSNPNSWDGLGKIIIVIAAIIICALSLPLVISGINTLRYLKGKNKGTGKVSVISSIISIILSGLFMWSFIYLDILDIFNDYVTGIVDIKSKIISAIIVFCIFMLPSIINIVSLTYKKIRRFYLLGLIFIVVAIIIIISHYLYRLSIINRNKIEVTEDNTYLYSDFKSELVSRNLIYELPENKQELTSQKEITALDSTSKYEYRFWDNDYSDGYRVSVNSDRKFPIFIYDSYTSLIKKSDKTEEFYYIGPGDWYINWYIYYIDGKVYAAIGEESVYGGRGNYPLSTTEYGIVVSEEENMTIYNSSKNYFVKGGGILDTRSGSQRSSFPTTADIYNEECMKIMVVDKVNAETLDKIAKELSPQSWKIFE